MKKKIALKWVEALRSGEYVQGEGELRSSNNSFCCLGVLCNLHAQKHKKIARLETDPQKYLGQDTVLPNQVRDWAGLGSSNGLFEYGLFKEDNDVNSLIELNDQECLDFNKIASFIEKNYKHL